MAYEGMTDDERRAAKAARKRRRLAESRAKREKARILSGKTFKNDPTHRCKAKTRTTGEPCPMKRTILEHPETGKLYRAATCYAHLPEKVREEFKATKIGGKEHGRGGRRPKPTTTQILKQMVEEELTLWMQPFFEALQATKPVVVGNGRHARVELLPDHRTRLQAVEAIFDRLYGKAKQTTELTGADGGPVSVEVPRDKERALEVAKILASAGAVPDQQEQIQKVATAARAADRN